MKNTIKLNIWAALIVLASQVNAGDSSSNLEVNMKGSKTFELTLKNVKGNVKFFLKNQRDQIMYQSTVATAVILWCPQGAQKAP